LQHHSPSNQIPETFINIKNPKKERKKISKEIKERGQRAKGIKKKRKKHPFIDGGCWMYDKFLFIMDDMHHQQFFWQEESHYSPFHEGIY